MTIYLALLRRDPDSDVGVDFPDFPGCITAGRTWEEANEMAREALTFHSAGMLEDGETIPDPSSLDAVRADPTTHDAVIMRVDVPAEPSRSVRINVTLPADLLQRIDRSTNNRSRILADAARARLGQVG